MKHSSQNRYVFALRTATSYIILYIVYYSGSLICLAELQRECKPEVTAVLKQRKIRLKYYYLCKCYIACTIHTPDRHTCITYCMCAHIYQACIRIYAYCTYVSIYVMNTCCLNTLDMAKHTEDWHAGSNFFLKSCSGFKW